MLILGLLVVGLPLAFVIRSTTDDGWREVTRIEVLEERDVIYLPVVKVFLVHGEDGPVAVSAISSHLRDRVLYCRFSETFQERHGSLFDRQGRYLSGPASRGLDRVGMRVRDGIIEINSTILHEGPSRAVPADLPSGDFCEIPGPEEPPGFAAERYDPSDDPL